MVSALKPANFNYQELEATDASKLQRLAVYVSGAKSKLCCSIVEIGHRLSDAHEILKGSGRDGKFRSWVEAECRFSVRTAYNYIRAFEVFGESTSIERFDDSAIRLLCSEKAPEDVAKKALKLADKGEYITAERAKELLETKSATTGSNGTSETSVQKIHTSSPNSGGQKTDPEGVAKNEPEEPAKVAPEPVLDANDKPVRKDLVPAFELRPKFREFRDLVNQAVKMAGELAEGPAGQFIHLQSVQADLNNAKSALVKMAPYAICPYCKGRQCQSCRDTGWVPKMIYDQAPGDKK